MAILDELVLASSPFPIVDLALPSVPAAGLHHPTPSICAKVFRTGACGTFYGSLKAPFNRVECPAGFSTWPFSLGESAFAVTGLVGYPRLGGDDERLRGKEFPACRADAAHIETWIAKIQALVSEGSKALTDEFARKLDALHEIRKFNAIVKANMERLCELESPSDPDGARPDLVRALRASSLISVQLDALDLLANPGSAKAQIRRKWVFYRTVDKMCRIYRVLAEGKNVSIRLTGNSTAQALVDERTIHVIPSAFIDNAIKYSPAGGAVEVAIGDELLGNVRVIGLRVRSRGPSATAAEEKGLFHLRGRGQAARSVAEGSGVGLSLAAVVAEQHKGVVSARQRPVTASISEWEFTFLLPIAID